MHVETICVGCKKAFRYGSSEVVVDARLEVPSPGLTMFVGPHASGKSLLSYLVFHSLGGSTYLLYRIGGCVVVSGGRRFESYVYVSSERLGLRATLSDLYTVMTRVSARVEEARSTLFDVLAKLPVLFLGEDAKRGLSNVLEVLDGVGKELRDLMFSNPFTTPMMSIASARGRLDEYALSKGISEVENLVDEACREIGVEDVNQVIPYRVSHRELVKVLVRDLRIGEAIDIDVASHGVSAAIALYALSIALALALDGQQPLLLIEDLDENAHPYAQYVLGYVAREVAKRGVTIITTTHSEATLAGALPSDPKELSYVAIYVTRVRSEGRKLIIGVERWLGDKSIPGFFRDSAEIARILATKIIKMRKAGSSA